MAAFFVFIGRPEHRMLHPTGQVHWAASRLPPCRQVHRAGIIISVSHNVIRRFHEFSQFHKRLGLNLAYPLTGDAAALSDGTEGLGFVVVQAESQRQDLFLGVREGLYQPGYLLVPHQPLHQDLRRNDRGVLDCIGEEIVAVLPHGLIDRIGLHQEYHQLADMPYVNIQDIRNLR